MASIDLKSKFMQQKLMRKVELSLIPIIILATCLFGLRTLLLLSVVLVAGILSEYIILRNISGSNAKVSEAVIVTCTLYTLTLPPSIPYWTAIIGIVFGVIFGKGVFGGFGKNIFNPALVGRCFIYIAFPAHMTVKWLKPFVGFPGGFFNYTGGPDAITSATPIIHFNKTGEITDYIKLALGNISGSLGETSAILILIAAAYLIFTKTASWKIIASTVLSFLAISSIFYFIGAVDTNPLFSILTGGILFGAVFMATDPISAPSNDYSKIIYGVLIGVVTFIIRSYSLFTEGIMFSILIANTFAPLIDRHVKTFIAGRKVKA